jgi:hypothetical protein
MLRWICFQACRILSGTYKPGDTIMSDTNPNALYFKMAEGDIVRLLDRGFTVDLDETVRIPYMAWDDHTFPMTPGRQGALSTPAYDYTNLGLSFPKNDADDIGYAGDQFKHKCYMGANANIRPHIHWRQQTAVIPVWTIEYRIWDNGDPEPDFGAAVVAVGEAFTWVDTDITNISFFPHISIAGLSPSAMFNFKFYRDDNTGEDLVLGRTFDFHYQIDSFGSGREYYK